MQKLFTLIITMVFMTSQLFSQAGELDLSFADEGIFIWDISSGMDTGKKIEVQDDGKIVVAGSGGFAGGLSFDFYVTRLNEDGSVDETFGENGIFHFPNDLASDLLYDMEIMDDGKIMVSGSFGASAPNPEFMLIKLNANGTPDSTFAENGVFIQTIDVSQDYANAFTFNDEGQIIVAGTSKLPGFGYDRNVVTRLSANGVVDSTFGTNGIFMWNENNTHNDVNEVLIADDGNILVAGRSVPFGTDRMVVYKVLADGSSIDSSWAENGAIFTPFEGAANDMIIHSNGNILVTGSNQNAMGGRDLVVLAYNQDGTPNTGFGTDGVFYLDVNLSDIGLSLFEQPDGKIITGGESGGTLFAGGPRAFFSTRMDANGNIDTSWGGTGYVATQTSTWMAWSDGSTMQPDGKFLLVGLSAIDNNDLTVIRYGNFIDQDQDGFGLDEDCNDLVYEINPDAEEIPNNDVDEDCDGIAQVIDLDGDGYDSDKDCDDMNAAVNPGAEEIPYNGLDDDCDETTPDDDLDGDGFILADDCDDMNAYINPDAEEIPNNEIDEDCDGMDLMVGVNETELAQQFSVYPNPAQDEVFIELEASAPIIDFIEIFDATGKKVQQIKTIQTNTKLTVNLHGLPQGMWIIALHTEEGTAVKRVVKN